MRKCIACGGLRENGNEGLIYDYCQTCYGADLELLHKRQREQQEKEGPFSIREDVEEAPASNPLVEDTHR